jgi:hypothetical protein
MVVIGGFLLGVLMGALAAIRGKGKIADIVQYAIGYGVAFGLTAWILAIILERLLG